MMHLSHEYPGNRFWILEFRFWISPGISVIFWLLPTGECPDRYQTKQYVENLNLFLTLLYGHLPIRGQIQVERGF